MKHRSIWCRLGLHKWEFDQEAFQPVNRSGRNVVVIAWRVCVRCAASRLIHILR